MFDQARQNGASAEGQKPSVDNNAGAIVTAFKDFLVARGGSREPSLESHVEADETHLDFYFPGTIRGTIIVHHASPLAISCRIANSWDSFHETAVFATPEEAKIFLDKIIRIARRYSDPPLNGRRL
jgi:hypothetical protein